MSDRLAELETEIGEVYAKILRPLLTERDQLLAAKAEAETYRVPRRSRQTDTQRKLERCPRCRGRLEEAA